MLFKVVADRVPSRLAHCSCIFELRCEEINYLAKSLAVKHSVLRFINSNGRITEGNCARTSRPCLSLLYDVGCKLQVVFAFSQTSGLGYRLGKVWMDAYA